MNKVIYDQDGFGERDHNFYGLLVLLQAPGVELVGITTVSGREWSPRQRPRALEALQALGWTEIPVVGGAVFPLVNSAARNARWEQAHGPLFDALCFDLDPDNLPSELDPFWLPEAGAEAARRGARSKAAASRRTPKAEPSEPAAVFMVRMARQYPGEISLVAVGPLTNLALACRLDPEFPRLIKALWFVGGRFQPYSRTGHFSRAPGRREANLRHDPEAAHIVLQAEWASITCLPRDLTDPVRVTREMHERIARARTPVGRFIKSLPYEFHAKGDALAAALSAEPELIAKTDAVCLDVDLSQGPNHGCLINWRDEAFAPVPHPPPIRVVTALHEKAFARQFAAWCTAGTGVLTQRREDRSKSAKHKPSAGLPLRPLRPLASSR